MKILCFLCCLVPLLGNAQNLRAKYTCFGESGGAVIFFLKDNYSIFSYSNSNIPQPLNPTFRWTSACIANEKGEIQFTALGSDYYIEDAYSYNTINQIRYIEENNFLKEEVLVLPRPETEDIYDVFITHWDTTYRAWFYATTNAWLVTHWFNGFQWNVVDMKHKKERSFLQKNQRVEKPDGIGKVIATQHKNGSDFWVVFHGVSDNTFRVFPVTRNGLELDREQIFKVGLKGYDPKPELESQMVGVSSATQEAWYNFGKMKFSSNGKIIVRLADYKTIEFFRFDNETGKVYCPVRINPLLRDNEYFADIAISPNGRYLYTLSLEVDMKTKKSEEIAKSHFLCQYDLFAEDIAKSKVLIREDGILPNVSITNPTLKMSPFGRLWSYINGKIYYTRRATFHHVIDKPNEGGLACNLLPANMEHPNWHPYIPNSRWFSEVSNEVSCFLPDQTAPNYPFSKPYVEMPNAFTPNGDGVNDSFVPIRIEGVTKGSLAVYNAWGKEVFKTEDILSGWSGAGVAAGTYYYTISYAGSKCDEANLIQKGWVQVLK